MCLEPKMVSHRIFRNFFVFFVVLFTTRQTFAANSTPVVCWRKAIPFTKLACPVDYETGGALCYPVCEKGFTGLGPMCWGKCEDGFTDIGAFCHRVAKIISADNKACPWYDICGLTFKRGCSKCPPEYSNDGCTCRIGAWTKAKPSNGRGVGYTASAMKDKGHSFVSCPTSWQSDGKVCWQSCPANKPSATGALCLSGDDDVTPDIKKAGEDAATSAIKLIESGTTDPASLKSTVENIFAKLLQFAVPEC